MLTKPSSFEGEVAEVKVPSDEAKLANTLIQSLSTDKLDYSQFKDVYLDRLKELIQAKVEGREVVAAAEPAQAHVVNLMDALRQSVAAAQGAANGEAKKPAKKMAPSAGKKPAAKRKKA
ncbi:hypothetical protein AYO40_03230 [Planctomycetaceae bacterium SCGC AG-212-D15]|nr:hypothetical protein AYO40_03230 [Planctomycetaceae bacterium SCGC AG-212-D15]